MNRYLLLLAWLLLPQTGYAAACCAGGNPKSFISLQRLQTYEVGILSSYRDVYGEYDQFGQIASSRRNQTTTLSIGAGARLTQDLQVALTLPIVNQLNRFSRTSLGDIIVAAQYTLLESLFQDDWFPTIQLTAGVKAPTGREENIEAGRVIPATGTGIWEPFVGVGFQKSYGPVTLGLRGSYSARLPHAGTDKGDAVDLIESVAYSFSQSLSVAAGAAQTWTFRDRVNGQDRTDSATRIASLFVAPTYFLSRYWSVGAGFEASLPWDRTGVNQQAYRTISLTTKYGFY